MTTNRLSSYLPRDPREALAIVGVCAAGLFVFGGDLLKLADRVRNRVRTEVRERFPLEMEIDRARELAASMVPDLCRNHVVIVRKQLEIDDLDSDITLREKLLRAQRDELTAANNLFKTKLAERKSAPTRQDATDRRDLRRRLMSLQAAETTLDALTQMRRIRQEALDKAKSAQSELLLKKTALQAQVTQLAARMRLTQGNSVDGQIVVDREKMGQCEELLRYLDKRMTVAESLAEFSDQQGAGSEPAEISVGDDRIEVEIDHHLEHGQVASNSN